VVISQAEENNATSLKLASQGTLQEQDAIPGSA